MREDLNKPFSSSKDALSREYPPAVPICCNDCPWRRSAAPGWLGPYNAHEWTELARGEAVIACHQTIPKGEGWGPKTMQCRGAATFRANVCKMPRNPTIESGPADHEHVFSSNKEFIAYHGETNDD